MRSRIKPILLVFSCLALAIFGAGENTSAQTRKAIYQINVGGPAVGSYMQDSYFEGGSKYDNNDAVDTTDVPNAPPLQVYKTQRYGNFLYALPNLKPNAPYIVRLHFAEIYFNNMQVGRRVFNVSINRQTALDHFDILATAGAKDRAIVREFTVPADANGTIRVVFESIVTNATINAIEILQGPPTQSSVPVLANQNGSQNTTAANTTKPSTSPTKPANDATKETGAPASAQEDNARLTRLSEIAHDLQDPNSNTVALLTEAARLCGFAIWREDHTPIAGPTGPPLHLAVTDAEIRGYAALFRAHHSVALADLIDAMDYMYKQMGAKGSCRADVLNWLQKGTDSENPSVRALTAFLQDISLFRPDSKFTGFDDPAVEMDPIQTLFIIRVLTEDMTAPVRRSLSQAAQLYKQDHPGMALMMKASFKRPNPDICGDEKKGYAEDAFVGVLNGIYEKALDYAKEASKNFGESAELYSTATGRLNAFSALSKFILTYTYLKGEMFVDAPGQPLIRTKDTRGPGDGPRTVVAKFSIDGSKLADWLKEHRCVAVYFGLDTDMPKSGILKGIETSWRIDQPLLPSQHIVEPVEGQGNPDRIPVNENTGEARYAYDGARQPKKLPEKVAPYNRFVHVYVTPQVKNPEVKQDLVDALLGAYGARNGGPGLLTPVYEELYRLKWKGTVRLGLMVRDWRPAKPDEVTGGLTIFLQADAHDFRKNYAWKVNYDRKLEFKDVTMSVIGGDVPTLDPESLAKLPPLARQQLEAAASNDAKKITFFGFGPGRLSMTVKDKSSLGKTLEDCEVTQSEDTGIVTGPKKGAPAELEFGPLILPGMTLFTVEVDLEKKIAIIKGDYALPVTVTSIRTEDKKTTTTDKDATRTIFQQLVPQAPYDPKGIIVPLKERSLEEDLAAVDATGYSYSGSVTIPFTFDRDKYKGNAYLTFYIKQITRSQ